MTSAQQATGLVTAIAVAGLMAAFLMPTVLAQFDGEEQSNNVVLETGETVELQPNLTATLDSTTAGTSATYTVNASGNTASTTVNVGSNQTVTVDGSDVTIAVTNATSTNATADFTYDGTYGWGGGAGALWTIIQVLIVMAVFLFFVGVATDKL